MNKQRPIFLDLMKIKFPPMAVASILHRLSGLLLFVFIPLVLWLFERSMSAAGFEDVKLDFDHPIILLMVWAFVASLIYHLLAGIRHLLMDMHWGEGLNTGRASAWFVIILAIIFIILAGIWLW